MYMENLPHISDAFYAKLPEAYVGVKALNDYLTCISLFIKAKSHLSLFRYFWAKFSVNLANPKWVI